MEVQNYRSHTIPATVLLAHGNARNQNILGKQKVRNISNRAN